MLEVCTFAPVSQLCCSHKQDWMEHSWHACCGTKSPRLCFQPATDIQRIPLDRPDPGGLVTGLESALPALISSAHGLHKPEAADNLSIGVTSRRIPPSLTNGPWAVHGLKWTRVHSQAMKHDCCYYTYRPIISSFTAESVRKDSMMCGVMQVQICPMLTDGLHTSRMHTVS